MRLGYFVIYPSIFLLNDARIDYIAKHVSDRIGGAIDENMFLSIYLPEAWNLSWQFPSQTL